MPPLSYIIQLQPPVGMEMDALGPLLETLKQTVHEVLTKQDWSICEGVRIRWRTLDLSSNEWSDGWWIHQTVAKIGSKPLENKCSTSFQTINSQRRFKIPYTALKPTQAASRSPSEAQAHDHLATEPSSLQSQRTSYEFWRSLNERPRYPSTPQRDCIAPCHRSCSIDCAASQNRRQHEYTATDDNLSFTTDSYSTLPLIGDSPALMEVHEMRQEMGQGWPTQIGQRQFSWNEDADQHEYHKDPMLNYNDGDQWEWGIQRAASETYNQLGYLQ